MYVTSLHVKHMRSHSDILVRFSPHVTLITGANGSGKTSLIEAIYIALQGTSFKGSDTDVLQMEAPWYRIELRTSTHDARTVKFDPSRSSGRKQFVIDSKTTYRMPAQAKYPVVLFEPDDLRLINGSPVRRRQFIDRFISQLDPQYGTALRRYERALRQRNLLLKNNAARDDLFAWNISLSEYGAYIIEQRIRFISQLDRQLNATYGTISQTNDTVMIRYSEKNHANMKQKILADLHAYSERDALLGFTSTGPHRHDVLFYFNGSPALTIASRGETRSIVLALKFLEIGIIEELTGKPPIVILDDVFSELDKTRQKHLALFTKETQMIITSATASSSVKADAHIELS